MIVSSETKLACDLFTVVWRSAQHAAIASTTACHLPRATIRVCDVFDCGWPLMPSHFSNFTSDEGGAGIVEMLFNTSLVCLVGAGEQASYSPRRLRLWNTKLEKEICDLNFVHTVLNVKLNRSRLVAVLEAKIHLFDLKTMKILHTLDTVPNPTGTLQKPHLQPSLLSLRSLCNCDAPCLLAQAWLRYPLRLTTAFLRFHRVKPKERYLLIARIL